MFQLLVRRTPGDGAQMKRFSLKFQDLTKLVPEAGPSMAFPWRLSPFLSLSLSLSRSLGCSFADKSAPFLPFWGGPVHKDGLTKSKSVHTLDSPKYLRLGRGRFSGRSAGAGMKVLFLVRTCWCWNESTLPKAMQGISLTLFLPKFTPQCIRIQYELTKHPWTPLPSAITFQILTAGQKRSKKLDSQERSQTAARLIFYEQVCQKKISSNEWMNEMNYSNWDEMTWHEMKWMDENPKKYGKQSPVEYLLQNG